MLDWAICVLVVSVLLAIGGAIGYCGTWLSVAIMATICAACWVIYSYTNDTGKESSEIWGSVSSFAIVLLAGTWLGVLIHGLVTLQKGGRIVLVFF